MPTYEELVKQNEELQRENKILREEIGKLTAIIALQSAEIERLKDINGKNSGNSSKPPSSNGLKSIANSRERSGQSAGGQKGHKGYYLALPENMEELIESGKIEKRVEDHREEKSEKYIVRYTIDIEVKTIVTEHRYAKTEDIPEEMERNEVIYGENIKAMTKIHHR